MRRIVKRCLFAVFFIACMSAPVAAGGDVTLQLDGVQVFCDAAPVIVEGRTLVPVRALFEAAGATVDWDGAQNRVCVSYSDIDVTLFVGKKTAQVNGREESMDVPAEILPGNRTFIPVRFVAQALGFLVDWDPDSRTVILDSPEESGIETTTVESIALSGADGVIRTEITYTGAEPDCRTFAYEAPDRFVVDIRGASIQLADIEGGSGSMPADNAVFSKIRYSQFEADIVRIVFDLKDRQTGVLTTASAEGILYIDFDDPSAPDEPAEETQPEEEASSESNILIPSADWRMTDQLVVIDAGHGGKDPGCLVSSGGTTYYEKDFNLEISLALDRYLREAGVQTHMLRTTDQTLALQERPVLANDLGADLYVSVHNNSAETSVPNGSQVFYYEKASEADYVIGSKALARSILDELLQQIGLADRGIVSQGMYAVLNKTCMPAVIVEGGFFSNPQDRAVMLGDDYTDLYARSVARAIILSLNRAAENGQGGS